MTEFFQSPFLGQATWLWLVFVAVVVALLAFDLGVLHRDDHEIGVRESLWLSGGYISAATLFGAWLWWQLGAQSGIDYFTGFLIEKSLSMDNVFVIAMIFSFFAIPRQFQHRVLFWGILGVIVLRALMIGLGAALVTQFDWVLYIFGAFLVFTGIKMLTMSSDHTPDLASNPVLRWLQRHLRVTPALHGNAFFVRAPHPTEAAKKGAVRTASATASPCSPPTRPSPAPRGRWSRTTSKATLPRISRQGALIAPEKGAAGAFWHCARSRFGT